MVCIIFLFYILYSYMLSIAWGGLMKETILLRKTLLQVQQTAPCDVSDIAHKSNLYYQPCYLYSTCADSV